MTCKDCLYHERCHGEIAYGIGSDDLTGRYYTDIETRCKGFKNKADYVEVVRCKNCKDFNTNGCAEGFGWCGLFGYGASEDHYCSYGERKEGAENDS